MNSSSEDIGSAGGLDVRVTSADGWYVFDGVVDSQATRVALFSLVPALDGTARIVDRLRVGDSECAQGKI